VTHTFQRSDKLNLWTLEERRDRSDLIKVVLITTITITFVDTSSSCISFEVVSTPGNFFYSQLRWWWRSWLQYSKYLQKCTAMELEPETTSR